MQQVISKSVDFVIRHWIIIGLFVVLTFGFYKFANTSRIEILDSSTREYSLLNQGNLQKTTVKGNSVSVVKTVPKGTYEINVSNGNSHAFKIVTTSGFFKKTSVKLPDTDKEKYREFVGDNPSECNFYHQAVLYSYTCGFSAKVKTHNPAKKDSPTYTVSNDTVMGIIKSVIRVGEDTIVLSQQPASESGIPSPYIAYVLGNGLEPKSQKVLKELDAAIGFRLIAYKTGYLAYSIDVQNIYYFANTESPGETIQIERPTDNSYRPIGLSVSGEKILTYYSNQEIDEGGDEESPPKIDNVKAVVLVKEANETKQYIVKQQVKQIELCGLNQLCVLGDYTNQPMNVYNISSGKAVKEFGVSNVRTMVNRQSSVLLATDHEILSLNTGDRSGYTEYSFGSLSLDSITAYDDTYILTVNDGNNRYYALRIDETRDDIDSIDKKIADLKSFQNIKAVSVYKQHIYISAYFGQDIYSEEFRSFIHNPEEVKKVRDMVTSRMDDLGIDRNNYILSGFDSLY